ncbi:MAG: S41 family peptidase [Gemmatimonadetes bacterium]|nr:S41 family peptidase [Gemmatimonadota bacterium]
MRAAIEGILRQLDAYSQYYDEEGLRQLRQDTTGKFAGLGITVGIMEQHPVVIAPIEGTPAARAGILPGDLIVGIEGSDTYEMTLETVVNELRGEPGTSVRITLERRGVMARWDVVIVREVIKIKSVAVVDELLPGVGYVSMRQTRFSEDTSTEVEAALEQLFARGVTGLIIDLRGNPGGLLTQAEEVADLFLPRGAPIVSVRERAGRSEETRVSQRRPPAEHIPLVILIDGGSASAAEIVAGAMQDNDRGLVIGTTSFGKGSVQTIFDLRDEDESALKLTTALYYTPSGRSIHRESLATSQDPGAQIPFGDVRVPAGQLFSLLLRADDEGSAEDQLRARFDLDPTLARQILTSPLSKLVGNSKSINNDRTSTADPETYHTGQGRTVYGGGGITPDVIIEADTPPDLVLDLYRRRVFFDFIVEYVGTEAGHQGEINVDEQMLQAFEQYLPKSAVAIARQEQYKEEIRSLRSLADQNGWGTNVMTQIDSLEASLHRHTDTIPLAPELSTYIRAGLRRELSLRVDGRRASLLVDLDTDPQVMEAVSLLRDEGRFQRLLHTDGNTSE